MVLLGEWGLIDIRRGHRAIVLDRIAVPEAVSMSMGTESVVEPLPGAGSAAAEPESQTLVELVLRRRGHEAGRLTAAVVSLSAGVLRQLLGDAIRRAGQDEADIGEYEMDVRYVGATEEGYSASVVTI